MAVAEGLLVMLLFVGVPAVIAALAIAFVTLGKANQTLEEARVLMMQVKRTSEAAEQGKAVTDARLSVEELREPSQKVETMQPAAAVTDSRPGAGELRSSVAPPELPPVYIPPPTPVQVAHDVPISAQSTAHLVSIASAHTGRPIASPEPAAKVARPIPVAEPVALPQHPKPVAAPAVQSVSDGTKKDRPEGFEAMVGKRILTWAGVFALFVAAALFAKFAFDQKWIGPGTQILMAVVFGLFLVGIGIRFVRRQLKALGQGLIGGGIMVLYVALFCAYSPAVYAEPPISSPTVIFLLMCLVTASGMAMSIVFDALAVSFLAVLGGFLTPVLVSTGVNQRDFLFAYILLLDLGVLAAAFWGNRRALDVLAFLGTSVIFGGWFHKFYTGHPEYAAVALTSTLLWAGIFFAVFLLLPFIHHLYRKTPVTIERFALAIANAAFFFGYSCRVLYDGNQVALAGVSIGLAAVYLVMGSITRMRIPMDARSFFAFIAFSMLFLTLAPPLYFGMNGVTMFWAAEAVMLLFLGYQFRYMPVRIGALIVFMFATGRVFFLHWPDAAHAVMFTPVFNQQFLILMCAPIGAAACAVIHRLYRSVSTALDQTMGTMFTIGGGLFFLTFLSTEISQWSALKAGGLGLTPEYLQVCARAVLWSLGAMAFLAGGWRGRKLPLLIAGVVPLCVALVHAVWLYTLDRHGYMLVFNERFMACLIACASVYGYSLALRTREARLPALIASGYLTLLLLSVELWRWIASAGMVHEWNISYTTDWSLAVLLAAGSCAYFLGGRLTKSADVQHCGLLPLVVAGGFAVSGYLMNAGNDYLLLLNWRFLAGASVCGSFVLWSLANSDRARVFGGLIMSGYLTLLLLSVELWRWIGSVGALREWNTAYAVDWSLAVLLAVGACVYILAGRLTKSSGVQHCGLLPLVIAGCFAAAGYLLDIGNDYLLLLNCRFLAGTSVCGSLVLWSLMNRERTTVAGGLIASGYLVLGLLHVETYSWISSCLLPSGVDAEYHSLAVQTILWSLGTGCYLFGGWKWATKSAFWAALLPLGVCFLCAADLFGTNMQSGWLLCLNMRFAAELFLVGALFAVPFALYRNRAILGSGEEILRKIVLWIGLVVCLFVLSAEPYRWCLDEIRDTAQAQWLGLMSLTVVWGIYASVVLCLGFIFRRRPLRFAALSLFALTAIKLVLLDLTGFHQIYRIVSFLFLGVVLVAAAYLYHKAEAILIDGERSTNQPEAG